MTCDQGHALIGVDAAGVARAPFGPGTVAPTQLSDRASPSRSNRCPRHSLGPDAEDVHLSGRVVDHVDVS